MNIDVDVCHIFFKLRQKDKADGNLTKMPETYTMNRTKQKNCGKLYSL